MKKKSSIVLLGSLLFVIFLLSPKLLLAGDLEQLTLRLERHKISTKTGGMICAVPQTTAVENSLEVTFQNGFTLNNNASNWSVSTSSIEPGSTAWPGIGTATAVSGNTVTFPSNDLTVGTRYCFNFSSMNTLTLPSTAGFFNATLTTKTNTATTIDSDGIGIFTVADDQISVSAATGLNGSEFQHEITTDTSDSVVSQNTIIEYRIKYGSTAPFPTSFVLEVSWDKGILEGGNARTEEVLQYMIGTATKGYLDVPPIIDTNNHKITWIFNDFPARRTDELVTLRLRTLSDYTGEKKINFFVAVRVIESTVQTDLNQSIKDYKYTIGPQSSTTTQITTPQPVPQTDTTISEFAFRSIDIINVSKNSFQFIADLTQSANLLISYGTNPQKLDKTLRVTSAQSNRPIEITGLDENSNYYFSVRATNQKGELRESDIFYVRTATKDFITDDLIENLVISSLGNILFGGNNIFTIVNLVQNSIFEFNIKLSNPDIKQVQVYLRPENTFAQVLGISTVSADEVGFRSSISEISNGSFFGRIRTPGSGGNYDVIAKIFDYAGNIYETKMFSIKAVSPIMITSKESGRPVEGARLYFSVFNEKEKTYSLLSPQVLQLPNPSYTDTDGKLPINLPEGKYRMEVIAIGFKPDSVDFEIGASSHQSYPMLSLEKDPELFMNAFRYYGRSAKDFIELSQNSLKSLSKSTRLFDLFGLGLLSALVIATWTAFVVKINLTVFELPKVLLILIKGILRREKIHFSAKIKVFATEKRNPVTSYDLVLKKIGGVVIEERTVENSLGEHQFQKLLPGSYEVQIIKEGYEEKNIRLDLYADKVLKIDMAPTKMNELLMKIRNIGLELIGLSFEVLMIFSIVLEILFIQNFGIVRTLPFLLISIINLLIFLQFIRISRN